MSLSARLLEIASRISQIPLSYYSTQLSSLIPKTSFSPHIHQISKLTILVLTITSIFYFTFISSHFSSSSYRTFALTTSGRKGTFLNSLSATDIDGPYDNSTLVELCRSRKWRKGLIFRCEAPSTGLVESRNVMLNCLRFGIEAGATNFILPVFKAPVDTNPPDEPLPFNHLFDLDHFTSTLTASCPQIKIIPHINDLWDKPSTSPPVLLSPNSLHSIKPKLPLIHSTLLANPGNWSSAFKKSLNASHPRAPTEKLPVLVSLNPPPLLQFPTTYDSAPFITNFGKLIRPSPDLQRLAATILYALSQKHSLNLLPTPEIQRDAFYGAVLSSKQPEEPEEPEPNESRTTTPIKGKPDLTTSLLTAASSSNLKTIYLATPHSSPGTIAHFRSTNAISTFTTLAQNLSIALETAESLLGGSVPQTYVPDEGEVIVTPHHQGVKGFEAEWNTYQTLTAVQKEVLDFEVLSRASLFGGNWENSLSWGVALKRHVVASGGNGRWDSISGVDLPSPKSPLPSPKTKPPFPSPSPKPPFPSPSPKPPFPSPKPKPPSPGKRSEDVEEVEVQVLEKRPVIDLAAEKAAATPAPTPTPKIRTITTPRPGYTRSTAPARTKPTGTRKAKARPTPTSAKGKARPRPTSAEPKPGAGAGEVKVDGKIGGKVNANGNGKVGAGGQAKGKGKGKGKLTATIKGETCFRDELSVVYGPRGEGRGWVLGGWP